MLRSSCQSVHCDWQNASSTELSLFWWSSCLYCEMRSSPRSLPWNCRPRPQRLIDLAKKWMLLFFSSVIAIEVVYISFQKVYYEIEYMVVLHTSWEFDSLILQDHIMLVILHQSYQVFHQNNETFWLWWVLKKPENSCVISTIWICSFDGASQLFLVIDLTTSYFIGHLRKYFTPHVLVGL